MNANPSPAPVRRGTLILAVAVLAAIAGLAYWRFVRTPAAPVAADAPVDLSPQALDRRLLSTEQELAKLARERAAWQQRLNESANRTNLLRDEVLGIGERAALIEDSVRELGRTGRSAQDGLRIHEAELMLIIARERWTLSGDLSGAIQATELAATALGGLTDPQWLDLRQTVTRELAAYRAIEADPGAIARGELDALEALLPELPAADAATAVKPSASGLQRLLDALVQIQPTGQQTLIAPGERQAAKTALALEIANARIALQRRQSAEFKASVGRIGQWLQRLYADTPQLRERRQRLQMAADAPLTPALPLAGSTLSELQRLKQGAAP